MATEFQATKVHNAIEEAHEVARGPAAEHAEDVDRHSRFPVEAVGALKARRLLGAAVPVSLGGLGSSLIELASIAMILAQECSATAMTWSMHQIQLACLCRHGHSRALARYIQRVCENQLLLASATSEVGMGGDIRKSKASLVLDGDKLILEKRSPSVSYGAYADGILATVRRNSSSPPNDQVLVLLRADDMELKRFAEWDALGMRGTCTEGFLLRARVQPDCIFPDPFERIASQTMVPFSHLLWSACWAGIANGALSRARALLRERARKENLNSLPLVSLAKAYARLQSTVTAIKQAAELFERPGSRVLGDLWSTSVYFNSLKETASETAVRVTLDALSICGFAGYLESGRFSVSRYVRDALSAPLMIGNDRLMSSNGTLLLASKQEFDLLSDR